MSRFRLYPDAVQEQQLLTHCGHARYVWNLAVEQLNYRAHRQAVPGPAERSRQLTEARYEFEWLAAGSTTVQQQALRDFDQALRNWWGGTHKRPTWRKQGRNEGFRVVDGHGIRVEQINHRWSRAWIPRVGWVRFRRTRAVPDARSFRVTRDPAGRWHIAFAAIPAPIEAPGNSKVVGVDRGVTVTLAYSDGTMRHAPEPTSVLTTARALARCKRESNRRRKAKTQLARAHARNADRRKDFVEKASTHLARTYDLIRIEDLRITNMTRSARGTVEKPGRNVRQKAGLNRAIMAGGWGLFAQRLEDKAPGRVEKVNPAYTSQTCAACGNVDARNRDNQAFRCVDCGHQDHADVNAARNIAAGRAVRGAESVSVSKRGPQRNRPPGRVVGIPRVNAGEDVNIGTSSPLAVTQGSCRTWMRCPSHHL